MKFSRDCSKEKRPKPKYGMLSCIQFMFQMMLRDQKFLTIASIVLVPFSVISYALVIYIPSVLVKLLEKETNFTMICEIVIGICILQLLIQLIESNLKIVKDDEEFYILMRMQYEFISKDYDMNYYLKLDKAVEEKKVRANAACRDNHCKGVQFHTVFLGVIVSGISFLLFGTMIASVHPLLMAIIVASCIICFFAKKQEQAKNYGNEDKRGLLYKKLSYLKYDISNDATCGKDIRIYKMKNELNRLYGQLIHDVSKENEKVESHGVKTSLIHFFLNAIRDGVAYIYLISQVFNGSMDASQFVLYFAAITNISTFLSKILDSFAVLREGAMQVSDYREYLEIGDHYYKENGVELPKEVPTIEFQHVSFKYPGSKQYVLKDINLKIEPRQKVALVGMNGSGKTTFTNLMCGLLIPTEGEIRLNGQPLCNYNSDELLSLFSIVPQTFSILPLSIAENIAIDDKEKIDEKRVLKSIELAGLSQKVKALPDGIWTCLNQKINENGIELSGGEMQKLLLARAFYHERHILILDEPTAALDPIAENELYVRYSELCKNVTSVYISHRLASTRFCDQIYYLKDGTMIEHGTHSELMELNGKYCELYHVQSQYYEEGEKDFEKEKIS